MKMQKRIVMVGTGALGGYIGGNLAHHGLDVTFVDMWAENLAAIRTRGLELDGVTAEEKFTVKSDKANPSISRSSRSNRTTPSA
jgi:2-dehydropantoate 2-reductase